MACYHPIPAYLDAGEVKLWPPVGAANTNLPCGSCLGCRQDRATAWARRAVHEASIWPVNRFVTLTYSDERLPAYGHLVPAHLSKFLKRLRSARYRARNLPDRGGHLGSWVGVRYLASGEYGDRFGRPHYHALLFNCGFADEYRVGGDLYESPTLARLWPYGDHKIGTLTGASANYTAQYTLKKLGKPSETIHDEGVVRPPEFARMSTKPALGDAWLRKYARDLHYGYLVSDGKKGPIPRAYKKKLPGIDPDLAEESAFNAQKYKRPQVDLAAAERIHFSRLRHSQR